MKAIIDIMLPYWGSVDLLKEAVDSVLAQTNKSWRLTILDDHYDSDEAREYFKTLSHPQITYIRHSKNKGITSNFNFAIKYATAPFCIILGCDDKLLPDYVDRVTSMIGVHDFCQPSVQVINAEGRPYLPMADWVKRLIAPKRSGTYEGEELAISLCHGDWLYFPSILWKTSTLKKYSLNPKYKITEDLDLVLRMIIDGATLYLDKGEALFQYRRFSESLSSKEKRRGGVRFNEEERLYSDFAVRFADIGWKKAKRAAKMRVTSRIHNLISR
jgi:GT2 family glycosyltransferase